ncbi:MAG: hypothetical protein Q7K21_02945, partial [Elusimicrobiota bacterium]|nr:hypothetical protein [Elusimicrobiota bacterium]
HLFKHGAKQEISAGFEFATYTLQERPKEVPLGANSLSDYKGATKEIYLRASTFNFFKRSFY